MRRIAAGATKRPWHGQQEADGQRLPPAGLRMTQAFLHLTQPGLHRPPPGMLQRQLKDGPHGLLCRSHTDPSALQPSAFESSAFESSVFEPSAAPSAFEPSVSAAPSTYQPSAFEPSAAPSAFEPSASAAPSTYQRSASIALSTYQSSSAPSAFEPSSAPPPPSHPKPVLSPNLLAAAAIMLGVPGMVRNPTSADTKYVIDLENACPDYLELLRRIDVKQPLPVNEADSNGGCWKCGLKFGLIAYRYSKLKYIIHRMCLYYNKCLNSQLRRGLLLPGMQRCMAGNG